MPGVYSNDVFLGWGALEPSRPRRLPIQGARMGRHVVALLTGEEGEMRVAIVTRLEPLKAGRVQRCLPRFAFVDTPEMVGTPADCGAVADTIVTGVLF